MVMHYETAMLHATTVDRLNQEKLYIQLTRIFLRQIHSGNWKSGRRIPSEEELCREYGVSKITVRQAVSNLVSDGYVVKIQGKGTFVTSAVPVVGLAMKTRFTEEMFGKEVESEKEVLYHGVIEPPAGIRSYLNTDDRIYQILCRRNVNGNPAYLDESYVPYQMIAEIEDRDFSQHSLYLLLQDKGVKKIFKVTQTIEIVSVSDRPARHLQVPPGVPALAVHRLLSSSDNTPVAYTRLLGRSDRYKFQTEFERIR